MIFVVGLRRARADLAAPSARCGGAALPQAALEIRQSRDHVVDGLRGSDGEESRHGHLEHEPGTRRARDLFVHVEEHLERSDEDLGRHAVRERLQPLLLLFAHVEVPLARRREHGERRVAHELEHLARERAELVADLVDLLDRREAAIRVPLEHAFEHAVEELAVDEPEDVRDLPCVELLAAEGDHLIEEALRVAHRAVAGARHEAQHLGRGVDAFFLRDELAAARRRQEAGSA